jgi:hypothetical protein
LLGAAQYYVIALRPLLTGEGKERRSGT